MTEHSKKAGELFARGFNCAQSVFAAYADEVGLDFETALKLSSSFGGGMGRLREVCGAVSAMFMIAGLRLGYTDPDNADAKAGHYKLIQELATEFREQNGSIICRELLGPEAGEGYVPEARTKEYYERRPCSALVENAAEIIGKCLEKNGAAL